MELTDGKGKGTPEVGEVLQTDLFPALNQPRVEMQSG